MKYCKRCIYPDNHPFGITFDEEGVCSGCRVHEEKDSLDWEERFEKLRLLLAEYRSKSKTNYDCIIPVNGARDSYFTVYTIKKVLGMNPLLVSYNKQYNTDAGIYNLSQLKVQFDCDCLVKTINRDIAKKITKATLRQFGSMYWHCLAGETVYPVETSVRFKIPLIILGVHQGCDQVGMYSHLDEVEMSRRYRKNHDLMAWEAEDLLEADGTLTEKDVEPYIYPHDKDIESVGVRGIYLSNYLRWDTKSQHELMIRLYNYKTKMLLRTFDCYNDVDSVHYSGIHDYLKLIKYGYSKVTDHACREIRLKRLSREDGIEFVNKYQYRKLSDLDSLLDWCGGISVNEFESIVENHRNHRVWTRNKNDDWELSDPITNHIFDEGIEDVRLLNAGNCKFVDNSLDYESEKDGCYVLLGKGCPDL